jgi:hypothetical protein
MVSPIGDDNTGLTRTPLVTYVFIALNVLVFVFLQGLGTNDWQSLRLNMPATSIRDLVIKDDDLVVGTRPLFLDTR